MTSTGLIIRLILTLLAVLALIWHLNNATDPLAEEIERDKRREKDPLEPPKLN